jgi:hypothetical protein
MKKTFPLQVSGQDGARVLAAVKHEVRKYVQREQRKTPPEGFNRWEFNCRVGADATTAAACRLSEVIAAIEAATKAGAAAVYVEILAVPVLWTPPEKPEAPGRMR